MIILGSVTILMGIFTFFFLIDNPKSKALNLNAEQEILVEDRTRDNAVVRTTTVNKGQIKEALFELRFWCFCFACLLINLQNGAMTIYNAQLIQDFGFTVSEKELKCSSRLICGLRACKRYCSVSVQVAPILYLF